MSKDVQQIPDSPIYLLGICDKFNEIEIASNGVVPILRKDIIGLKDFFISQIFPFSGNSFYLLLILDNNQAEEIEGSKLILIHESGKEIGFINFEKIKQIKNENEREEGRFFTRFTLMSSQIPGLVPLPGECTLYLQKQEGKIPIGRFYLAHQAALPFTKERIQALKTDPLALKYVTLEMGCKECGDKIRVAAGIDKEKLKPNDIWYEDVSSIYVCSCGKINQDMTYIKNNLHGLLGHKPSPFSLGEEIERNYTHSMLEKIADNFWKLIENEKTTEEQLQKFIENNPIILSQFSPELLKFKAPVNSMFKTDFALVNQKKEICLIEIEKSSTPLFTKKGIQHSKLIQSISQVEDWQKRARRNRLALLDDLKMEGIKIDDVTGIRGIVIAGRSLEEYNPFIEKLRERKDIEFYTYDDLFKFLRQIISKIKDI